MPGKTKIIYEPLCPIKFRRLNGDGYITGYGSRFLTQLEYDTVIPHVDGVLHVSKPIWWSRS